MPTAQANIYPSGFFVLRSAALPWETFASLSGPCETNHGQEHGVSRPTQSPERSEKVRRQLHRLVSDPFVREAIFLASPDLIEAFDSKVGIHNRDKQQKIERSLLKYLVRMCGRATPFGLFAGSTFGTVADVSDFSVGGRSSYRRHTRLDMDYLCNLANALSADPDIRRYLRFSPNTSLYSSGNRTRFTRAEVKDQQRSYHLLGLQSTQALQSTLKLASGGMDIRTLAEALVDSDVTFDQAEAFVLALIENQILVSDLHPAITGPEPIHDLIDQLTQIPGCTEFVGALVSVRDELDQLDREPVGHDVSRYFSIASSLKNLPAKVELNRLFQTDLVNPEKQVSISTDVVKELERAIVLLHGLFGSIREDSMRKFVEAFQARYEGREVQLVEVLDDDAGIGFESFDGPSSEASPLLDGIGFPPPAPEVPLKWRALDQFLLNRLVVLIEQKEHVLRLKEEDLIPFFQDDIRPLPNAFAVLAQIGTDPAPAGAKNFKVAVSSVSGPSGAKLLGRFCHGDDSIARNVQAHIDAESNQNPGAIFAEIVHLPEGRTGNILHRPLMRSHEIPYLGRSGSPRQNQIHPTDLYVSVRDGKVILRSKSLGKEVIPRLTSAHNFRNSSIPMYRFLCALQAHAISSGLEWNWGVLEAHPFLPRVEVGETVLCKARWRVFQDEIQKIRGMPPYQLHEGLASWRKNRGLPRHVVLVDGDNKLPIDFEIDLSVDTFLELVKGRDEFVLEEFYPAPNQFLDPTEGGSYVQEVVVPFCKHSIPAEPMPVLVQNRTEIRRFYPGSEWLYAKVYCGPAGADQLLREEVLPFVHKLQLDGLVDGWFFIRYGDPDWHVRLRFHGVPTDLAGVVLNKLTDLVHVLESQGIARKLVLDTYEREIERYGGDSGIRFSEKVFEADSNAAIKLLGANNGSDVPNYRWKICLLGMDRLLEDFGFDLDSKLEIASKLRTSFMLEFRGGKDLERQLGIRFRRERRELESLLAFNNGSPLFQEGQSILQNRFEEYLPSVSELRRLGTAGDLDLKKLVSSFLHMSANRILRSAHRAQELVLYDFLTRIYESQLGRVRSRKGAASVP